MKVLFWRVGDVVTCDREPSSGEGLAVAVWAGAWHMCMVYVCMCECGKKVI